MRFTHIVALIALLSTAASSASADVPDKAPPVLAVPTPAPSAKPASNSLDFDFFTKPPVAATDFKRNQAIDRKVHLRRRMLTAHQAFGIITLTLLAATLVVGQLNYYDKYTSGDFTERYAKPHLYLGVATTALFATTASLALFAPNPYPKKGFHFDTTLIHKAGMTLAAIGMLTEIILGAITSSHIGKQDQESLALAHLITGYASFGFMAAGTISLLF